MDLKKMTVEELTATKNKLHAVIAEAKIEARAIAAEIEDRLIASGFDALPEAHKEAIRKHVIGPGGIPSAEKFGKIGGKA